MKRIILKSLSIFSILLITGLLYSCDLPFFEKEGDYVESMMNDFVTIWTDSEGTPEIIQTDRGERFLISEVPNTTNISRPDTIYRMICTYEVADNTAKIYSFCSVESDRATNILGTMVIHSDPVEVKSIWIGGGYLNVILSINVFDKAHVLYPIYLSQEEKVSFVLFHDSNNDSEGYSRKAYLSIPLAEYNLERGDSVFFNCCGYEEDYRYSLVY